MVKFEEMTDEDDDESDKHLEARDRRYSCLISPKLGLDFNQKSSINSCELLWYRDGFGPAQPSPNYLGLGLGRAQTHPYPGITNFDTRVPSYTRYFTRV